MKTNQYILRLLALAVINPIFLMTLPGFSAPGYAWSLLMAFLTALIQAVVLAETIRNQNGQTKWSVTWKIFALFYGVTFFQSGIEAVLFLHYMQDTMSLVQLNEMILHGLLTTLLVVPVAVLLFYTKRTPEAAAQLPSRTILIRISVLSLAYVVVYIFFGGFVFKPLAGAYFDTYYGNLQLPDWLFPFQVVRGMIWALLAWGLMTLLPPSRTLRIYLTILFIALPISSLLLPVNEIMPAPIRMAHLIEVTSSMVFYGWLCGWYLSRVPR